MTTATLGFAIDSTPAAKAASDLDVLVSAASRTEAAVDRMGSSITRVATRISGAGAQINQQLTKVANDTENLAKRIERALDIRTSFSGVDRGKDIAAYGQELDRLRGKFNPVFNVLSNYKTALGEIRQAQRLGAISADEMAAAISRERQAALASIGALKQRQQAGGGGGRNFAATNAMYQFQDVAVTAAMGMSPLSVGLQQGSQIAGAYAGMSLKAAAATTASAVASLVSPVSIAAVGFTALAAAAIQYGSALVGSLDTTGKALEKHEETLKRIKSLFDDAAVSGTQYGQRTQAAINFGINTDRTSLQKALKDSLQTFLGNAGSSVNASQFDFEGLGAFSIGSDDSSARFGKFTDSVKLLVDQIHAGTPDVLEFNRRVQEIANTDPSDKQLQKIANTLLGYTKDATAAAEATAELNRQQRELSLMMSRTTAAQAATTYQANNADARFYGTRRFDAAVAGIGAKSPRDQADAERRRLEAEPLDLKSEDQTTRELRIAQQVELTYREANQAIIDAQRERARSLDALLDDQQSEIDLVGKTGGAAAALRKEYELTAAVRADAARNGVEVDQAEIDLIKQKSAEYGKYVDLLNQRKFDFDLSKQFSDARLSARDLQIIQTQRQYGFAENANDANGRRIGQLYDWQQAKDIAKGFGDAFTDELVNGSHNIGKAFLQGFESALNNYATKLWDKFFDSFSNLFADWLTGTKGSGAGSAVGSVATALMGGTAANDNAGTAAVIPVTKSMLGDIASYASAIKSIESSGNYSALGPITSSGDRAYGAYQVMGANVGPWTQSALGYSMTPSAFLGSPSAQDAVFSKIFGGYTSKYGASGAAQAWFGGPGSVGSGGNAADMLGTTGTEYVTKFNTALSQLSDTTSSVTGTMGNFGPAVGTAAQGLNQLGSGLGQFSQQLVSAASGANNPSGWLGSLGGLFGGVSPTSSMWSANTTLGSFLVNGYADGTDFAPGGLAVVGEEGPELVELPMGGRVHTSQKTMGMLSGKAANSNSVNVDVKVVNNNGSDVKVQQKQTSNGVQLDVIVDQAVADKMSTPGSLSRAAVQSQFGLTGRLARR